MAKVVRGSDFRIRQGEYIRELNKGDGGMFFVANETFVKQSFIVMTFDCAVELARKAGRMDLVDSIGSVFEEIVKKVSEKYRKIRSKR